MIKKPAARDQASRVNSGPDSGSERGAKRQRPRRLKKGEPLEVELTVSFKFGDEPGDVKTPIKGRRVPMVDSVFKSRDRIIKTFVGLLVKTGLSTPKVASQILPITRLRRDSGD